MKNVTAAEFDAEVLHSKESVLVDFYTDSCQPCRMMSPVLQEMEVEADGQIKVVKIDAAAEAELASSYGVRAVPTFLAFAQGKCVGQTIGMKSKANLKKWFDDSVRNGV